MLFKLHFLHSFSGLNFSLYDEEAIYVALKTLSRSTKRILLGNLVLIVQELSIYGRCLFNLHQFITILMKKKANN